MANYVKFRRGTPAQFAALSNKENDTLYFIFENNEDDVKLYLGSKLIACGKTNGASNLADLQDVVLNAVAAKDMLVYEGGKWVNKSVDKIISAMTGATAASAGVAGLVPAPAAGDQDKYLRADGKWVAIKATISDIDNAEAKAHTELLAAISNPAIGDMAIIKDQIGETGKYQHTAYVRGEKEWEAMDGNYNAENVYFAEDLTYTANIGVMSVPSSGSGSIKAAGKNVKEVLSSILAARKTPARNLPAVSVSAGNCKAYEVGTTVTPSYSASLSTGSYTYGPATGITAKSWNVSFNGETKTEANGSFSAVTVADNTSLRITATASYDAGAVPKDNLGNLLTDAAELSKCQIQASSATNYSGNITGFRYLFHGSKVDAMDLDSANIRKLTAAASTSGSVKVTVVAGAKQVIVAVPAGRKVTKVADEGAFGTDIFSEFTKQTVSVGGADATAENIGAYAKDYNVYVYTPATALGANTYTVTIANE